MNVKKGYHHRPEAVMLGYPWVLVLTEIAVILGCLEAAVEMIELEALGWNLGSFRHRHRHHGFHLVEAFACVHRSLAVYFVFVRSVCRPTGQVSIALQLGLRNP
jgi:hypothetical protein